MAEDQDVSRAGGNRLGLRRKAVRTSKTRHQFYLPDALSAKLEALAAAPGTSKTSILSDALQAWTERQGAQELDGRFGPRFDRLGRASERVEEKLDILNEAFGLFVLHQLTLTAHQPAFDTETLRLGRDRYDRFVSQAGRSLSRKQGLAINQSKKEES